jgi:hypothetical protein
MGLGLILDSLCVVIGVIVLWMVEGCRADLKQGLRAIKAGDFYRRPEGIIGLVTVVAIAGLIWVLYHLFG